MSIILVVKDDSDHIIEQVAGIGGLTCHSSKDIEQAKDIVNKNQFDYVICDYEKSQPEDFSFIQFCKTIQPFIKFYYIIKKGTDVEKEPYLSVINKAEGYLETPITVRLINDLVNGDALLDQNEIDSLFESLRSANQD